MSTKKRNTIVSADPETRKLQEMIEQNFRFCNFHTKEIEKLSGVPCSILEKSVKERRTEAIMHYMSVAVDHFKEKYTADTVQETFARFCCSFDIYPGLFSKKDSVTHWSAATAIWILDKLKDAGKLSELNLDNYSNPENFPVELPDLVDSVHPKEILYPMITLVKMQMIDIHQREVLLNSQNAKYGKIQSENKMKYHQDFLNVIGLLDTESIQSAVKNLEEKIWEIIEVYFDAVIRYCSVFPDSDDEWLYSYNIVIQQCVQTLETEVIDHIEKIPNDVAECLTQYCKHFTVENPFEICFAVFYLIATGNDLVWLYTPLLPILEKCWRELPWCKLRYNFNIVLSDESNAEILNESEIEVSDDEIHPDLVKIQRAVYYLTRTLLPRDIVQYQIFESFLEASGFSTENAELLAHIVALASAYQECMVEQTKLYQQKIEKLLQKNAEIESRYSTSLQELNRLKAENTALSKALKEERHRIKNLEREKTALKEQNQNEHEELILLHEYLYSMNNDEEITEKDRIKFQFPYFPQRHIACLGGTEPWISHIADKLPGVVSHKSNIDKFKSADEIWVQICGLNPKEYFPVRDLAESRRIPIRFFKYSGAGKCAEQLAEYDMRQK